MASLGYYANVLKYKLAVASARKIDNPLRLAHAVRHLGDALRHAGQTVRAEACYVEALSIYRSREDTPPLDLANAIRGFAILKDETGAVEEAQGLWQEAHALYVQVSEAPGITDSWRRGVLGGVAGSAAQLALLAWRQGDLQRSSEWLDKANAAGADAGDAETLQHLSEVRTRIETAL